MSESLYVAESGTDARNTTELTEDIASSLKTILDPVSAVYLLMDYPELE